MPFRGRQQRPNPRGGRGPERSPAAEIVSTTTFPEDSPISVGNLMCTLTTELEGTPTSGGHDGWSRYVAKNVATYTYFAGEGTIRKGDKFSAPDS